MESDHDIKDWAIVVLPHLDYDSQLKAILNLLSIHKEAEQVTSKDIREITESLKNDNILNDDYLFYLESERGEKIQSSVYQDAAHSMAAVGMLGPLIESVFHHAICCILEIFYYEQKLVPAHSRFERGDEKEWDCHYVWSNSKQEWIGNLEEGIAQCSEAIGLKEFLPRDLKIILSALFSYRNKMFHCGFEWPLNEREMFAKRIEDGELPTKWFTSATSGDKGWVFYLSEDFITHCLDQADAIISGIGMYVKDKIGAIPK